MKLSPYHLNYKTSLFLTLRNCILIQFNHFCVECSRLHWLQIPMVNHFKRVWKIFSPIDRYSVKSDFEINQTINEAAATTQTKRRGIGYKCMKLNVISRTKNIPLIWCLKGAQVRSRKNIQILRESEPLLSLFQARQQRLKVIFFDETGLHETA